MHVVDGGYSDSLGTALLQSTRNFAQGHSSSPRRNIIHSDLSLWSGLVNTVPVFGVVQELSQVAYTPTRDLESFHLSTLFGECHTVHAGRRESVALQECKKVVVPNALDPAFFGRK